MSRKKLVSMMLISLFIIFALTLTGQAQEGEKETLTVAQVADITTLDPQKANDIYSANVMTQIYNKLVKMDKEMNIVGDLAKSWENPDDNTWIFNLKEGIKFHNGQDFTAEDVKFTIERLKDPSTASPGKWLVEKITEVEVVDDYTIKLITNEPFAPLLSNLARYEMFILNKEAVEKYGENYADNPVGTGPFMFEEHIYGDKVILSKFEDYYKGPSDIEEIVYRAIPEDATRVIEIESGGIDIMYNMPVQELDRLGDAKNLNVIETLGQSTLYMGFNFKVEPFDNKKVRQALNYAVDKKGIIDAVFYGKANPSYGPLSPSIWGFDKTLEPAYPYNPEKAKKLLEEAGYPDGLEITAFTDPRTTRKNVTELVQAYLSQIGVKVDIQTMEWSRFLSETASGINGMFILGWTGTGDADGGLYPRFHSSNMNSSNRHNWATDELDTLLEKGRTTVNTKERKEIYKEAQRYIIDEASDIFIAVTENIAVATNNIKGFELYPSNINPLYNVKIEK